MANDYTIENKGDFFAVYKFGVYGRHSVLRGQTRKTFIEGFETEAEAVEAYPKANIGYRDAGNTFNHLPGEDDPVSGGMFPDDEW